jgi:hypothetical protein
MVDFRYRVSNRHVSARFPLLPPKADICQRDQHVRFVS